MILPTKHTPRLYRFYLPLIALALMGLGLRLFRLGEVPIGAHGDIAWKAINALDWLRGGAFPFYIYELYAPEPVNVYLMAFWVSVLGPVFLAARLSTALASTLTILVGAAAAWGLARFAGVKPHLSAALFAVGYALSFTPILLSKTGQRAQLFPLLVALLLLSFAYAWRTGSRWAFAACAVILAVANYTYIPARLMPFMLLTWAGYEWLIDRGRAKQRLLPLIGCLALAALLISPQLVTYLQTPEAFFARSDQAAGRLIFSTLSGAELWLTLGRKFAAQWAIFVLPWRGAYAEMGRPLLPLALGLGAVIGLVLAFRRLEDRLLWWPLIGIPILFTTDVLSGTQSAPHGLRMIGVLPLAFLLGARGLALLIERLRSTQTRRAITAGALALIGAQGLFDWWDYHYRYIPALRLEPGVSDRLEASDAFIAELIRAHADQPILITLDDFTRANIVFLLSDVYPQRGSALDAEGNFNFSDQEVLVLMPDNPYRPRHDGRPPEHDGRSWVLLSQGRMRILPPLRQPLAPQGQPVDTISDWQGNPVAALTPASLSRSDFDTDITPANFHFGWQLRLSGWQASSAELVPGQPWWVTFYWRATDGAHEDYEIYAQLIDRNGQAVAQVHRWAFDGVYRTRLWPTDELTPAYFVFNLPADLPPGPYTLITGLYRVLHNEAVPVVAGDGMVIAEHAAVARLRVPLDAAGRGLPQPSDPPTFGDLMRVQGLAVQQTPEALNLRVDWQALRRSPADYTLFLHLVDEGGSIAAQLDAQPRGGAYPTGIWLPAEIVPDDLTLPLSGLPPGTYTLYAGWYDAFSGERLAVPGTPDGRAALAEMVLP